jgi:tetratricopeptide (TPR) repeat protein
VVASALAQVGQIAQALEVARSIGSADWRAQALGAVALALAQADRKDEAGRILTESLEVAHSIQFTSSRADALSAVASVLAQVGQIAQALEVARSIEDAHRRADALSMLASVLAQADQCGKAFSILQSANFYDYLRSITKWVRSLEKHKPALSLEIMSEVIRIIGWVWPQWHQAYDILTTSYSKSTRITDPANSLSQTPC